MFTYVISDGISLKIGKTGDVDARLRSIQCGNPRPLFVVAHLPIDVEKDVHFYLEYNGIRRHVGEWFEDSPRTRRVLANYGFSIRQRDPLRPNQNVANANATTLDDAFRQGVQLGWHRASSHYAAVFGDEIVAHQDCKTEGAVEEHW